MMAKITSFTPKSITKFRQIVTSFTHSVYEKTGKHILKRKRGQNKRG